MSKFFSSIRPDVQPGGPPTTEAGAVGGAAEQSAALMPPYVPPGTAAGATGAQAASGVVPPPAAPVYSMRPPESTTRFELEAESALGEKVRMATDQVQQAAQELMQKKVRVEVQRTKTTDSAAPAMRQRRAQHQAPASPRVSRLPRQTFDPVRAAQAGLLNVAWSWHQAGSPIRAIHAYMQLLERYPDTPAAAAAVADLVELSDALAQDGQFHTALAIYDQLEQLL